MCIVKGYLEELVRLRESQLKNAELENKKLKARLEERQSRSLQEKKELEAVVLELQEQLWVMRPGEESDFIQYVTSYGSEFDWHLFGVYQDKLDSVWFQPLDQKPINPFDQPVANAWTIQQRRSQVVPKVSPSFLISWRKMIGNADMLIYVVYIM